MLAFMVAPPGWTRRPHQTRAVSRAAFCAAIVNCVFPSVPNAIYDMNTSFNGGVRIGYNWQPTPYTLLGLENDFGYLHLKGSDVMNFRFIFGSEVATTKLGDWYDAYTARVGAVDGHTMLYLKGGGVTARYSTGVVFTPTHGSSAPTLNTTTTKDLSGWAAGGGLEYGIDMHWSLRQSIWSLDWLVTSLPAERLVPVVWLLPASSVPSPTLPTFRRSPSA